MFDSLEADIVVFQETKIQKKDLQDDMVLVPGWDCFFSLPKFKKGYSGVVIYTRNSKCCPIRAEEGITGILCPPASSCPSSVPTSFRDLPEDVQIGGYPTAEQLALSDIDAATLDSEGRCVILEFPAFVLIGVYCPANRDEMRSGFRTGFVSVLDARVRNLVGMGKRVVVTGDLNIAGHEIDSAHALEEIRKGAMTDVDYVSVPVRRIFNQLVTTGKVIGEKDEGRETPVLVDLCRKYHPSRRGMYTCWEQRVNARPGNFGSRIDYVLCDQTMDDWFSGSNIQEGLMGSDHCPVYADFKDKVLLDGKEVDLLDILNPRGAFENGERKRGYSNADVLPISGKLIPEFCQRRNIKDMFFRQSSRGSSQSGVNSPGGNNTPPAKKEPPVLSPSATEEGNMAPPPATAPLAVPSPPKRTQTTDDGAASRTKRLKRSESTTSSTTTTKAQKTLKGFFGLKESASLPPPPNDDSKDSANVTDRPAAGSSLQGTARSFSDSTLLSSQGEQSGLGTGSQQHQYDDPLPDIEKDDGTVKDPVANKESWSKLFTKKPPPRCEGHGEPCISLVTKKPGINRGRSFWICSRPLGPSGVKKNGDQWRCETFIWSSDWNGPG
ncbi:hypothetical protein AJ79_08758 [Helicocarpus griseus UAMH5409]|uniref:DNA-(apurinic or apyrimidinic site) endonuclease 2 n=1 Tax=Helicocarpus griseus UAMH5409 TaxID=1447875 RepID=A0A2B7WQH7_9EURO|nr:hypothetical protein AJ79_08758 [Helicocarpus griseus UAMH5409]